MMRAQFFSEDWPRSRKLHLFYGGTLQDSIVEVQVGGLMPALIHVRGHTLVQKQSQKSEDSLFDHQQSKKSEKSPKKSHFFLYLTDSLETSIQIQYVLYGCSCIFFIVLMVFLYVCKIKVIDSDPSQRHTSARWVRGKQSSFLARC